MSESALRRRLAQAGLQPTRWSNGPHAIYALHDHAYAKVLVVVSGSIAFTLRGRRGTNTVMLHPGDRLELPPKTPHSAVVGPDGVVCLEAHPHS